MIYELNSAPHTFSFNAETGQLTIDGVALDANTAWQLHYWLYQEHAERLHQIVREQAENNHTIDTEGEVPGDIDEPPF